MEFNSRHGRFAVLRAQAGDLRALDEVLRSTQTELHGYLVRLTGHHDVAEDVLQDTLLIVARRIAWLRNPACYRAWVFRIATREAMRRLRADRRRRKVAEEAALSRPEPNPGRIPDDGEIRRILEKTDRLPPNTRAAILLHYGAGLSIASVATVLGVPEGTAKSRVAYGLGVLRKGEGGDA